MFLKGQAETIRRIESAPGSRLMSAEESSLSAPFIDDAPHAQLVNLQNTAISYYPKGELIGMVMDLLVRGRTKGKASLDDIMRDMYEEFYLKSPNSSYYLQLCLINRVCLKIRPSASKIILTANVEV